MTYLRPPMLGNFKAPRAPKKKEKSAAAKRPGMDPHHLANIRKLPSCISGRKPCEAHHLRCAGGRGVSLKAEDRWAVPLTPDEHVPGVHRVGSKQEFKWFMDRGINPLELASALWANRSDLDAMERVVQAHRAAKEDHNAG